jgi:phosphoribosylformylglycinamidine synthase
VVEDVTQSITMDLKEAGNYIYVVGDFPVQQKAVPDVPTSTLRIYRALHQAIKSGLVRSAHDLSEGGLAVAAAEMCIGGRLGMELVVDESTLFMEVNGCLLVEVSLEKVSAFESHFASLPWTKIGNVLSESSLKIGDEEILVTDLVHAFNNPKHS